MRRVRAVLVVAALLGGCKLREEPPPDLSAAACEVDLSGAVTGAIGCTAFGIYRGSDDKGAIILMQGPLERAFVSAEAVRAGRPTPGLWTETPGSTLSAGLRLISNDAWIAVYSSEPALPTRGSFRMQLDTVEPLNAAADDDDGGTVVMATYRVRGTIDATLVADPTSAGSHAGGTVDLHARF